MLNLQLNTLIVIGIWATLGLYLIWPSVQNFRAAAFPGKGPRHRNPGLPRISRRGTALAGRRIAGV